jgi:hypothetical protein
LLGRWRADELLRGVGLQVVPSPDRDQKEAVLAGLPAEAITLQRGQHEELERGIVEGRNAAIDKSCLDRRAAARVNGDLFRLEISWRGRAGAYNLSQTKPPILRPVLPSAAVVEWPGTPCVEPLRHDHESRADLVAVERRLRSELVVQSLLERIGRELRREDALQFRLRQPVRLEDGRPYVRIERLQCVNRHATGETRRDDRASRGTLRYSRVRIPRIPPPSRARIRFGLWSGLICCCLVRRILCTYLQGNYLLLVAKD